MKIIIELDDDYAVEYESDVEPKAGDLIVFNFSSPHDVNFSHLEAVNLDKKDLQ
jgi:hypothetical protein